MAYKVIHGDVLGVLKDVPDGCFHGVLTDPPYALSFMSMDWDNPDTVFSPKLWAEIRRVLCPGGYVLAFGGSRVFHRLAVAIEDGGLILHDTLLYLFGTRMPHGLNVLKAIDREAGAEREVVGINEDYLRRKPSGGKINGRIWT